MPPLCLLHSAAAPAAAAEELRLSWRQLAGSKAHHSSTTAAIAWRTLCLEMAGYNETCGRATLAAEKWLRGGVSCAIWHNTLALYGKRRCSYLYSSLGIRARGSSKRVNQYRAAGELNSITRLVRLFGDIVAPSSPPIYSFPSASSSNACSSAPLNSAPTITIFNIAYRA